MSQYIPTLTTMHIFKEWRVPSPEYMQADPTLRPHVISFCVQWQDDAPGLYCQIPGRYVIARGEEMDAFRAGKLRYCKNCLRLARAKGVLLPGVTE